MVPAVGDKVADAFELATELGFDLRQRRFKFGVLDHLEGIRVEDREEACFFAIRIFGREEAVVNANFAVDGVRDADPVNGGAALDAFRRVGPDCAGDVFTDNFRDCSGGIGDDILASDAVTAAEANCSAGGEAEILFGRIHHEIIAFDPDFTGHGNHAGTVFRAFRVVLDFDVFEVVLRQCIDDDLDWVEDGHAARSVGVEIFADTVFKQGYIGEPVEFGDTDCLAEVADGRRRVAAAAHAGDSGHAGIVPGMDEFFLHELEEFALAHDRVGQIEPGEFRLAGAAGDGTVVDDPVVKGAVVFEFQGAKGVGDVFVGVFQRVGEVVHRIDAPSVAGVVVLCEHDAVEDGIPHVHVGGRHVDFGTEDGFSFGNLTIFHGGETFHIFFDGTVAERRFLSGCGDVAALGADILDALFVHIGEPFFNEGDGTGVEEVEHVAGEIKMAAPVETEPVDVFLDAVDVFLVFLARIGIVEAQVASPADGSVFLTESKVQADGFGVSNVKVSIGFRGETGDGRRVLALGKIGGDHVPDKIASFR